MGGENEVGGSVYQAGICLGIYVVRFPSREDPTWKASSLQRIDTCNVLASRRIEKPLLKKKNCNTLHNRVYLSVQAKDSLRNQTIKHHLNY